MHLLTPDADTLPPALRRPRLELIVVIVLVLLLIGSFPVYPYSRDWGYRGSGLLGTILLIVVILWLLHMV